MAIIQRMMSDPFAGTAKMFPMYRVAMSPLRGRGVAALKGRYFRTAPYGARRHLGGPLLGDDYPHPVLSLRNPPKHPETEPSPLIRGGFRGFGGSARRTLRWFRSGFAGFVLVMAWAARCRVRWCRLLLSSKLVDVFADLGTHTVGLLGINETPVKQALLEMLTGYDLDVSRDDVRRWNGHAGFKNRLA